MTKTLLIIGAGTSKSIHDTFPTGIELAIWIDAHLITTKKAASDSSNHPDCPYISSMINEAKRVFKYDASYLDGLIDQLKIELWAYARKYDYYLYRKDAPIISIDELISSKFSSNPEVFNLARQCVAYLLKGQEDAFLDTANKTLLANDSWIEDLYTILKSRGATLNDITTNLTIISFNYERLFEYLSCKVLNKLFGTANKTLPNINYIYGNFGTLIEVPFNEKNDGEIFRKYCYSNLKFIGERHNLSNKPNLDDYEKVLFIGFGYDKDNLVDTLSVKEVKTARLIGMCRNKTKLHEGTEREFNISINKHDTIGDFIKTNL